MKFLGIWALALVVGFIAVASLAPPQQGTSAVAAQPAAERDRLAKQLVNRLVALDNRQRAFCFVARATCEKIHKQITETVALIQNLRRKGSDEHLRGVALLVDAFEADLDPILRGMEQTMAKAQRRLNQ